MNVSAAFPWGPLLESLRPRQWTKNLILYAGVIFAQKLRDPHCVGLATGAFVVFCLASGLAYIFNDIGDYAQDRLHPDKRRRPIASGRLPVPVAWRAIPILAIVVLVAAAALGTIFELCVVVFLLWNVAYTRYLKRIAILDVVGIGISFVIRATAGVAVLLPVVPDIHLSIWLLLCPFFLSLFLGFAKRRDEFVKLVGSNPGTRAVLASYNDVLLNVLIGSTFGLTLACYAVYTIWPSTVTHFGTRDLVWTVPFVFLGLWRYMFLAYREGLGGRPHEILLNDPVLQLLVIGWVSVFVAIIGLGNS